MRRFILIDVKLDVLCRGVDHLGESASRWAGRAGERGVRSPPGARLAALKFMKSMTLFLIVTFTAGGAAQAGTIDFNSRIEKNEVRRSRLEKRMRAKTAGRPKRIARVSFDGEIRRRDPKPKAEVRAPSAQRSRQSGSFELVMRPKTAK